MNKLAMIENKKEDGKEISVVVPKNGFEKHTWFTEIVRTPMVWFLNALPTSIGRSLFLIFSGPKGDARIAFRWPATYRPLERMYTFWERKSKGETNASDNFWETFLDNARAIRNRLRLLKQELRKAIQEMVERKGKVNLLSLGSGSARGVFETINSFPVRIRLIDTSRRAISFSKELARIYGIRDIEWYRDWVQNLEEYCEDFRPDVVEMVGLLDYFPYEEALKLIRRVRRVLSPGGCFIVSNILPNPEAPFVTRDIEWPLVYRTPAEIEKLLKSGGFETKGRIFVEPLKVYALAVAKPLER